MWSQSNSKLLTLCNCNGILKRDYTRVVDIYTQQQWHIYMYQSSFAKYKSNEFIWNIFLSEWWKSTHNVTQTVPTFLHTISIEGKNNWCIFWHNFVVAIFLSKNVLGSISIMKSQIARFMWPTCGPPGSCRPQMGPYWPHEPCYQGCYRKILQCIESTGFIHPITKFVLPRRL